MNWCLSALLSLLLLTAVQCHAQGDSPLRDAGRVDGLVEAGLRLTGLAGGAGWMATGAVGLGLGDRTFVVGEGATLLEKITLREATAQTQLSFGYGGVAVERFFASVSSMPVGLRVFVGAGRARSEDAVSGFEAGTENVFVLRPSLVVHRALRAFLSVGMGLGYRQVWGADELPGLSGGDLNAVTASVSLRALRRE